MSNPPIQSPVPPDLRALLDSFKSDLFANFNAHKLGIVTAFDQTKQTASVQITTLVQIGDQMVSYPLLTDCPIYFPAGGGAYFTFPVKAGDICLVAFNDYDLDKWFTTGNTTTPNTPRTHSLSDGIVFVGLRSLAQPLPNMLADSVSLWYKGANISINDSGDILLRGAENSMRLDLADKANLSNASTTLRLLFDNLCDTLTAWVNTGGSTPNPATLTAIAAVKAQGRILLT